MRSRAEHRAAFCAAAWYSRLVVGWEEVSLEGLAAVASKADLGRDAAADEHDMGQQATESQLGAELLLEVPEVAAGGQRLVHVLAEHVLCHYGGFNVAVSLQQTNPEHEASMHSQSSP